MKPTLITLIYLWGLLAVQLAHAAQEQPLQLTVQQCLERASKSNHQIQGLHILPSEIFSCLMP